MVTPPLSPTSTDAVKTLVDYVSMTEHLPRGGEVSPPMVAGGWVEWANRWRGEMCLQKVLEKLNLEYLPDSED
jgi:hypothetical protein